MGDRNRDASALLGMEGFVVLSHSEEDGETTTRTSQRTSAGARPVPVLCAARPNEVWSWDISPIATSMRLRFFYLYAVIDIFSRFVPGWCVEEVEDKDLARELFEKTCTDQGIAPDTLTVHSDNGPQMRSDAMNEFYAMPGISKSRSRPRVSNDNPYSETLFKTAKYVPLYPGSFETIEAALNWFASFFTHYNYEHYSHGGGTGRPAPSSKPVSACSTTPTASILSGFAEEHPRRQAGAGMDQQTCTRRSGGGRHSVIKSTKLSNQG